MQRVGHHSLMLRRLIILLVTGLLLIHTVPVAAQDGASQAGIDQLLAALEADFGVTAAFPGEWQAASAGEVQQLYDGLHVIYAGFEAVAYRLWVLDGAPDNLSPSEHFHLLFDAAHLSIDRTFRLGNYAGNTAPLYENGVIAGYMIQLGPAGMSQPFTLAHEMGHVVDAMLGDQPHQDHIAFLGGTVGSTGWIPGRGFEGNALMFPRAQAGANEDFADTFGQMMMGNLSPLNSTAPRWAFMVTHTHLWLDAIRAQAE